MYYPIPIYLSNKIYAYYKTNQHILFDEQLTILLQNDIIGYRKNKHHIIFL